MAFQLGGQTYTVNALGADITGFDPSRDRLDFGDISLHGLILGKLVDGTAVLVNPWQVSDYQRILDCSTIHYAFFAFTCHKKLSNQ